jgi:transposase
MNEIKRLHILQQVVDKQTTRDQAAQRLGLSLRQVRRLIAIYREKGAAGLVHGNRWRKPNYRVDGVVREKILTLAKGIYQDYNDSHFTEELAEKHAVQVSRSTVRRIRRQAGQGSPRKHRSPKNRSRRERREQAGMLLQADGSRHDWLEGREPKLTLIAYIDDATNEVLGATFREEEDAAGYFLGLQAICLNQGVPAAIYADRHTIFQNPTKDSNIPHSILPGYDFSGNRFLIGLVSGQHPVSGFSHVACHGAHSDSVPFTPSHAFNAKGRRPRGYQIPKEWICRPSLINTGNPQRVHANTSIR